MATALLYCARLLATGTLIYETRSMIWGLIGLIAAAILLAVFATRRNMQAAIPVALLIIIGVIGFFAWYQDHELDASKRRIPPSEVELADTRLTDLGRGAREVAGRLRNHSTQYTLREVDLRVSIEDCVDQHCEIVDQSDIRVKPTIPPGQARDFSQRAYFKSTLQLRGELRLRVEVTGTRGE